MNNLTITIVGNNNVGKSSLFNFLTNSQQALVNEQKGITIDNNYGKFYINKTKIICIDTISYKLSLEKQINSQLTIAIKEANIIIFLVDAIKGLTFHDIKLSHFLHLFNKKIFLLVNKIENKKDIDIFWQLGYIKLYPISLIQKIGIHIFYKELKKYILSNLINLEHVFIKNENKKLEQNNKTIKKIVVMGLPNVGKSTLVNTIIKNKNRLVVDNKPGTTHDAVTVKMFYKNNNFSIIDTAGLYKYKKKYCDPKNYIILNKSLKMINLADLILFVLDANKPLCTQNFFLLNYLIKIGKNFFLVVNKIDILNKKEQKFLFNLLKIKLSFIKFKEVIFISALHNMGIKNLLDKIILLNDILKKKKINTSLLTNLINTALLSFNQNNNYFISKKIKFKYAHLGGWNPILIIIHGTNVYKLSNNYKNFVKNVFYKKLKLPAHQIKIFFKEIF